MEMKSHLYNNIFIKNDCTYKNPEIIKHIQRTGGELQLTVFKMATRVSRMRGAMYILALPYVFRHMLIYDIFSFMIFVVLHLCFFTVYTPVMALARCWLMSFYTLQSGSTKMPELAADLASQRAAECLTKPLPPPP